MRLLAFRTPLSDKSRASNDHTNLANLVAPDLLVPKLTQIFSIIIIIIINELIKVA